MNARKKVDAFWAWPEGHPNSNSHLLMGCEGERKKGRGCWRESFRRVLRETDKQEVKRSRLREAEGSRRVERAKKSPIEYLSADSESRESGSWYEENVEVKDSEIERKEGWLRVA